MKGHTEIQAGFMFTGVYCMQLPVNTSSARYELSRTILVLVVRDVRDNSYSTTAVLSCVQRLSNTVCRTLAIHSTVSPSGE